MQLCYTDERPSSGTHVARLDIGKCIGLWGHLDRAGHALMGHYSLRRPTDGAWYTGSNGETLVKHPPHGGAVMYEGRCADLYIGELSGPWPGIPKTAGIPKDDKGKVKDDVWYHLD